MAGELAFVRDFRTALRTGQLRNRNYGRILFRSVMFAHMAVHDIDRPAVSRGKDWQYVKFTEQMQYVLRPHEDGTFELVMAVSSDV